MRPGTLRWTISLQRKSETVADAGTVVETWGDLAPSIRAQLIAPVSPTRPGAPTVFGAVETDRAPGAEQEAVFVFRIRWRDYGLTIDDRVLFNGLPHQITGITELNWRDGIDIRCRLVN